MSADTRLRYACAPRDLGRQPLDDTLALLAGGGGHGVALGPGDLPADAAGARRLRERCDALCLEVVLDLAGPDAPRLADLQSACDVADVLRAEAVVLGAGGRRDDPAAWDRAVEGLRALVDSHGGAPYALAVQPRPGTPVADAADWARLADDVPGLALALDARHEPAAAQAVRDRGHLAAVAADADREVLQALVDVTYDGLVRVDLPAPERVADVLGALLAAGG